MPLGKAPAGRVGQMPKISSPTNPMRLAGGGAFILPSMVGVVQPPNERQTLPERDGVRFQSLRTSIAREVHETTLRLRREC